MNSLTTAFALILGCACYAIAWVSDSRIAFLTAGAVFLLFLLSLFVETES